MNIFKLRLSGKHLSSESFPAIETPQGEIWLLNGKLHRYGKPAAILDQCVSWWWRGIQITKEIAERSLPISEIIKIENIELRQCAIEIYGYERFQNNMKEIDRATPEEWEQKYPVSILPMYRLFLLESGKNELNQPIKLLSMCDPSKIPIIRYFVRVAPTETNALDSVAHSYGFKDSKEFFSIRKLWV